MSAHRPPALRNRFAAKGHIWREKASQNGLASQTAGDRQTAFIKSQSATKRASRLQGQLERQTDLLKSQSSFECSTRLKRQLQYEIAQNEKENNERSTARLSYQRNNQAKTRGKTNDSLLNSARSAPASEILDNLIDEHTVGTMNYSCPHCGAKFWEREKLSTSTKDYFKFSLCCEQGKVVLPTISTPPECLMNLLTATDKRGRAFRDHIRAYNSALAFTSFGVNLDKELANARSEVYTFRIHGVVHHYIGQLTRREGEAPSFAQIYIHDGTAERELENRQRNLGEAGLPEPRGLQDMLHEVNPYVFYFRQGNETMKEQGASDVRIIIRADGGPDHRCYNAPMAPKIAVIMPGEVYTEEVATRDIVLHARTGGLRRITECNCSYDSLHYVLLFPSGDNGWQLKIPHSRGNGDVTPIEFYSYRLM